MKTENNTTTKIIDLTNAEQLNNIGKAIAIKTLKAIYKTTANETIRKELDGLYHSIKLLDFHKSDIITANDENIAKSYDLVNEVITAILETSIFHKGDLESETIPTTRKGESVNISAIRYAFRVARKYIDNNTPQTTLRGDYTIILADGTKKTYKTQSREVYFEDLRQNAEETTENIIERVVGVSRALHIDNAYTYNEITETIAELKLSPQQQKIVWYRLKGYSVMEIAKKMNVSHQLISKQLKAIQKKYNELEQE